MRNKMSFMVALLICIALAACSPNQQGTSSDRAGGVREEGVESDAFDSKVEASAADAQTQDNKDYLTTGINPNTSEPLASFLPLDNLTNEPWEPEAFVYAPPTDQFHFIGHEYIFDQESLRRRGLHSSSKETDLSEPFTQTRVVVGNQALHEEGDSAQYYENNQFYVLYSRANGTWEHEGEAAIGWGTNNDRFLVGKMNLFAFIYNHNNYTDGLKKLADCYLGMQEYMGINCWVFDFKGMSVEGDKLFQRLWVDPSNGICLRVEIYGEEEANDTVSVITVAKYDLVVQEFPQELVPMIESNK